MYTFSHFKSTETKGQILHILLSARKISCDLATWLVEKYFYNQKYFITIIKYYVRKWLATCKLKYIANYDCHLEVTS